MLYRKRMMPGIVAVLPQLIVNGVLAGLLLALAGVGFVLEFRATRVFNFAYAALLAVGAYASWMTLQLPPWRGDDLSPLALLFAMSSSAIAGGCASYILDSSVFRRLRVSRAAGTVHLLASLGLLVVLQNALSLLVGDHVRSIRPASAVRSFTIPLLGFEPVRVTGLQLATALMAILAGSASLILVNKTRWGQNVRAVSCDQELAGIVGVNVGRVHAGVRLLGGALAGVAGAGLALDSDLSPVMGARVFVLISVAMVIGGLGSVGGVVAGALLVGLIQNLSVVVIATRWQDTAVYVALIVFLLYRPQGLFGRFA